MVGTRKTWGATLALALATAAPALGQNVQIKIATLAPEGSVWLEEGRRAADEIEEHTGGRVKVRYYPGGTMGSDETVLRKMRIGQLQGAAVLSGSLTAFAPDLDIYSLPLLFESYDEVDYVRGRVDGRMLAELEHAGLVTPGLVETGFVYVMSDKPTRSFEELTSRKAWLPEGDIVGKAIFDAAGVSPVPLAISDVLTGLQTGLVDTVAAPPVGAVTLQWFTKARYVTDLPITYAFGALVLSDRTLQRLSPADREVVRQAFSGMTSRLDRQARLDNQRAREALVRQGVVFVEPAPEVMGKWREVAGDASRHLIDRLPFDRSLIDEVRRLLADFRARPSASGS